MNVSDFLNANAYPVAGQNARCKYLNKGSQITLAALTTEYNFFTAPLGNPFTSNFVIPFSGDNVFFLKKLALYCDISDVTITGTIFGELMQSFLEIWVNDRQQYKGSLIKFLNFGWQNIDAAVAGEVSVSVFEEREKVFVNPIIINSTANIRFRLHMNAAAVAALVGANLFLVMTGFQFDKLKQFEYDELMSNQFQRLDFDMYDIQLAVAAANNYQLFANPNRSEELFSKVLPLSESETFQVEAIQVIFSEHAGAVAPNHNLWFPRKENRLSVYLNDVSFWDSYISKALCYYGDYVPAAVNNRLSIWRRDVLETPILIPAKSNNSVVLQQPASTTPAATQPFLVSFEGEITRRVA